MNLDLLAWLLARTAGLTAFLALSISVLSGLALRTALFERLASNRALLSLHRFTTVLWAPCAAVHLIGLLLDQTARIRPFDLLLPFQAPYGALGVGLGTVSAELFALVTATAWLRRRMDGRLWRWLHRLAYPAFALAFVHALLAGTDFSDPLVSAVTWAVAAFLLALTAARLLWGRLPA